MFMTLAMGDVIGAAAQGLAGMADNYADDIEEQKAEAVLGSPGLPTNVRYLGSFGTHILTASFTAHDPKPTSDALRSSKHEANGAFPFGSRARL